MARTIYASFTDISDAERAAGALLDHGVRTEDLSLVSARHDHDTPEAAGMPYDDYAATSDVSSESNTGVNRVTADYDDDGVNRGVTTDLENANYTRGSSTGGMDLSGDIPRDPDDVDDLSAKSGISTTTGADAAAGAAKGAGVGLGVGAVAALASLFVPGFGLVVGSGALATAIGGMAATTAAGAVAGGVTGYLKDQGVDEESAQVYDGAVRNGGAVLAITVPSGDCDEATAGEVIAKYGGSNVNTFDTPMAA
jgi:hypothetical protein